MNVHSHPEATCHEERRLMTYYVILHRDETPPTADLGCCTRFATVAAARSEAAFGERIWSITYKEVK